MPQSCHGRAVQGGAHSGVVGPTHTSVLAGVSPTGAPWGKPRTPVKRFAPSSFSACLTRLPCRPLPPVVCLCPSVALTPQQSNVASPFIPRAPQRHNLHIHSGATAAPRSNTAIHRRTFDQLSPGRWMPDRTAARAAAAALRASAPTLCVPPPRRPWQGPCARHTPSRSAVAPFTRRSSRLIGSGLLQKHCLELAAIIVHLQAHANSVTAGRQRRQPEQVGSWRGDAGTSCCWQASPRQGCTHVSALPRHRGHCLRHCAWRVGVPRTTLRTA